MNKEVKEPVGAKPVAFDYAAFMLRKLKSGQRFTFYRGPSFESLSHKPEAYYEMMMRLRETANSLVLAGLINVERTKSTNPPFETSYTAVGIAP